jgi:hypothetical protein
VKQLCWTVLIALLIAGCRQQASNATGILITLSIEPASPVIGTAEMRVTLTSVDNQPITDAKVTVRGDMNHAGMVPVIAEAERVEGNEYVVPFEWTMAGDWIVEVSAELTDGTTASQTFDQSVAAGE